jgi:hypothetical protein
MKIVVALLVIFGLVLLCTWAVMSVILGSEQVRLTNHFAAKVPRILSLLKSDDPEDKMRAMKVELADVVDGDLAVEKRGIFWGLMVLVGLIHNDSFRSPASVGEGDVTGVIRVDVRRYLKEIVRALIAIEHEPGSEFWRKQTYRSASSETAVLRPPLGPVARDVLKRIDPWGMALAE